MRETQRMRGRPVTNAEAVRAAERLISRAHGGGGEKSTMSIPVQPTDDDVLLTDYLMEVALSSISNPEGSKGEGEC